jgi:hypothetical protein
VVERCRFTLLVLTPNYVASKWTNLEAMLTMQGERILPLIKEPAKCRAGWRR